MCGTGATTTCGLGSIGELCDRNRNRLCSLSQGRRTIWRTHFYRLHYVEIDTLAIRNQKIVDGSMLEYWYPTVIRPYSPPARHNIDVHCVTVSYDTGNSSGPRLFSLMIRERTGIEPGDADAENRLGAPFLLLTSPPFRCPCRPNKASMDPCV